MRREESSLCAAILMVVLFSVLAALGGFASSKGFDVLAIGAVCGLLLSIGTFTKVAGIPLGRPHMLTKQILWEALISVIVLVVAGTPWALQYQLGFKEGARSMSSLILALALALVASSFGGRGAYLTMAVLALVAAHGHRIRDPGNVPPGASHAFTFLAMSSFFCILPCHKRDQSTLLFLAAFGTLSWGIGAALALNRTKMLIVYVFVDIVFLYLLVLWLRRQRTLTAGLQGCRFVRLDYLRRLAEEGGRIRRCQDLPPEAFGDFTRAQHLLVVSHRWLDRYACDLPTLEYPEGLRLHTMLQKLQEFFSTQGLGKGQGLWGRWRRLSASLAGGRDVVLFIDFMSLPQVGKAPDGSLIPRSDEDEALFQRCLPNMGLLYSMFPVLVCEEVVPDVPSYNESGWCYAEFTVASLGKQLSAYSYSSSTKPAPKLGRNPSLHGEGLRDFFVRLDSALASKHFKDDGDREVVRGIISRFAHKSRLVEAIESRDPATLAEVLSDLRHQRFYDLLNQPVDPLLNTPLHLAVARRFTTGVEELVWQGAELGMRNLRGDTAVQHLVLPRVSRAAVVVLQHCRRCGTSPAPPAPPAPPVLQVGQAVEASTEVIDVEELGEVKEEWV